MINHMVSDPVRAITSAKKKTTKAKYENTYLEDFEKLVPYGSDKKAYEARVEEIINSLKGARRYYVSAFPFYNTQNSLVYNLIHCTSNKEDLSSTRRVLGRYLAHSPLPSTRLRTGSCHLTFR